MNPQWIKGNASYYSVAYLERNAYAATQCSKFFFNVSAFYYTEYDSHEPTNTYRSILMLTGTDTKSGSIGFKNKTITGKGIGAQLTSSDFQTCCLMTRAFRFF